MTSEIVILYTLRTFLHFSNSRGSYFASLHTWKPDIQWRKIIKITATVFPGLVRPYVHESIPKKESNVHWLIKEPGGLWVLACIE